MGTPFLKWRAFFRARRSYNTQTRSDMIVPRNRDELASIGLTTNE